MNAAFRDKYGFPFPLLSDGDRVAGEAYETAPPADSDRARFARRATYLVDPEGVIARSYDVEDIPAHPAEVLSDLLALRAERL